MAYNKSDLVSKIAQKSNLTKAQAEAAVNAFPGRVRRGNAVRRRPEADRPVLRRARQARSPHPGRNPRTGETIEISGPTYGVRISAGSLLKKAVTK